MHATSAEKAIILLRRAIYKVNESDPHVTKVPRRSALKQCREPETTRQANVILKHLDKDFNPANPSQFHRETEIIF